MSMSTEHNHKTFEVHTVNWCWALLNMNSQFIIGAPAVEIKECRKAFCRHRSTWWQDVAHSIEPFCRALSSTIATNISGNVWLVYIYVHNLWIDRCALEFITHHSFYSGFVNKFWETSCFSKRFRLANSHCMYITMYCICLLSVQQWT